MALKESSERPEVTTSGTEGAGKADILVRNAYVVTLDSERRVYVHGAVAIEEGVIVAVGPDREVTPAYRPLQTINAHGAMVHPGFIDTHIHLSYHIIRWACQDGSDWSKSLAFHGDFWKAANDETEYSAARLAALEMACNGTTCFLEAGSVITPDAAASAVEEIGIRGLLSDPFVRDMDPPGTAIGRIQLSRQRAFDILGTELRRNSSPDALVRGVVTLSGMGTVSDELELAAKELADKHGVVLNQHQSYQAEDAAVDDQRRGQHPLVHFAEIGLLGENCTFSHMNILREDELDPVVESGMSVVWCPMASMLFGVGGTIRGKHAELHKLGANVALGCDSANWTSSFNVGDQAFMALATAREKTGDIGVLMAEDIVEVATINGARAVGLADQVGSLEVGKRGDLVVRHEDVPEAHPGADPIRSVAFSSRSRSIDTVIVNGEVVVEGGHSARVDEEEVYARSREAYRRLLERMGGAPPSHRWPQID